MSGARRLEIGIDGTVRADLLQDLVELEVSDGEDHSRARLTLVLRKRDSGDWTYLDPGDEHVFALWQRLRVRVGFGSDLQVVFDGYVAHIAPDFSADASQCTLAVSALGASFAMDQEDKLTRWEDQTFSQVARAIFQSYGLAATVDDTRARYRVDDTTLLQRGTDWQFLQQLAQRVGFECFVEGATGYFRAPVPHEPVQRDIAVHFGRDTNAIAFRPVVHAGCPTSVELQRVNLTDNAVESAQVSASPLPGLGSTDNHEILAGRAAAGRPTQRAYSRPVTGLDELSALATARRQDSDWYVDGEGELDGELYGAVLRARRPVLIKGVGTAWSGTYFVRRVEHRFTPTSYRQRFAVLRNRMGQTGQEAWTTAAPGAAAATVVGVQTAESGEEVMP